MCEICGRTFRLASTCRSHFKTHSEDKQFSRMFKCDAGNCKFSTLIPGELKKHEERCVELQVPETVLVEVSCDETLPVTVSVVICYYSYLQNVLEVLFFSFRQIKINSVMSVFRY